MDEERKQETKFGSKAESGKTEGRTQESLSVRVFENQLSPTARPRQSTTDLTLYTLNTISKRNMENHDYIDFIL